MSEHPDITERIPGLRRRKDGLLQGAPSLFTVIGLDVEATKLKGRYKGTAHEARACELIDAAEQKRRVAKPPTAGFIETCRGGLITPVIVADLWPDKTGKSHALIMAGRKRRVSIDTLNAEPGAVPLDMLGVVQTFRKSGPRMHGTIIRAAENCRNPRSFSERAEEAADMMGQAFAVAYVIALVEARDDKELNDLLALHECCEVVKDAVDEGHVLLSACGFLAKQDFAEQERIVARRLAGNGKGNKDAAAPPRAKTCKASTVQAIGAEFMATNTTTRGKGGAEIDVPEWTGKEVAALMRWVAGDITALAAPEYERMWRVVDSADAARKGAGT